MKRVVLLFFAIVLTATSFSQQSDSITFAGIKIQELLQSVKISGLLQTQYQRFEPDAEGLNNRISVRRARLKFSYHKSFAQFVFQFHATEKNVGPDEAYIQLTDPWTKTVSLTTGIFNRPFGHEISYSSSLLESDERARVIRTLYPEEKDLGAMLSFQPGPNSLFSFIRMDAGVFNGTGPMREDFDNRKNFIGRISSKNSLNDKMEAGLGVSWFKGGFSNQRTEHYIWNNGFVAMPNDTLALSEQNLKGVDAQFSIRWAAGTTLLRVEYVNGTQAGTFNDSKTSHTAPVNLNGDGLPSYIRKCQGGYFIFIHEINNPHLQFVCKYDWYDPNTYAGGNDIGRLQNTGLADIRYANFGTGINYWMNENIRAMVYCNFARNERTSVPGFISDRSDNNLVVRLQYSF